MCGLFVGERRHHDHFDVGLQVARRAQQIDAAHVRHLHVGNDHVGGLFPEDCHRFAAILRDADRMSVTLKQMRQKLTHAELVVND